MIIILGSLKNVQQRAAAPAVQKGNDFVSTWKEKLRITLTSCMIRCMVATIHCHYITLLPYSLVQYLVQYRTAWATVCASDFFALQLANTHQVYHSKVLQDKGIIDKGIIRTKVLQDKGIVRN